MSMLFILDFSSRTHPSLFLSLSLCFFFLSCVPPLSYAFTPAITPSLSSLQFLSSFLPPFLVFSSFPCATWRRKEREGRPCFGFSSSLFRCHITRVCICESMCVSMCVSMHDRMSMLSSFVCKNNCIVQTPADRNLVILTLKPHNNVEKQTIRSSNRRICKTRALACLLA